MWALHRLLCLLHTWYVTIIDKKQKGRRRSEAEIKSRSQKAERKILRHKEGQTGKKEEEKKKRKKRDKKATKRGGGEK